MANYYTGCNNLCQLILLTEQNHSIFSNNNNKNRFSNKVFSVAETTAELCVAGTRKTPAYSSSSTHHLSAATSTTRRTNLFPTNRIQPSSNHFYDTHLPSIRDTNGTIDRHNQIYDEYHSRSKTLLTSTSPKSNGRPPSASISSIFNALAKRSTENFTTTYADYEETNNQNPVPPSRRSQRPNKGNGTNPNTTTKQTIVHQKQSGDSGIDIRFSSSSADTNHQQRALGMSARARTNAPQIHVESPLVQDIGNKERTHFGQLYQRRQNNSVKTPTKQKIDKYRRRSEEVTQAMNGSTPPNVVHNGLSNNSAHPSFNRPKPPPPSPTAAVRRTSSEGEIQSRLDALRLSMDTNGIQTDQQLHSQSQQYSRNRVKSPYLYTNHQQTKPATPTSNPQTPSVRLRRSHGTLQPTSSVNSSQHQHTNNRRAQQQQQNSAKQLANPSPGNLYLAFIASRHLSTLEDALFECDIDHQKLLRIFTWLKGVEDYRHEQSDHDQLLIEQNQRMVDQEENLSLYSEIQHAVDDLPANTTGKPCEKIATMQFED